MTTATIDYPPTGIPDCAADLLLRVRDGNPATWKEIVRRYGKFVTTMVRSFRLQEADAFDAVQTTWLRLAEMPTGCSSPKSWADGWRPRPAANACTSCDRPNLPHTSPP